MLLTISTTHQPATDLGYLLHKRPGQVQSFDFSFGKAHIFYPEVSAEKCTIALLLEVDPIGLVRNHHRSSAGFALKQYVNDRPYVASSYMSVSIAKLLGSALNGKSKERPELVEKKIPLVVSICALPCQRGEQFVRQLFEPLGYKTTITSFLLDEKFPGWGHSPYFKVQLEGETRLKDLLTHLYVLIPVLDDEKHYWVGDAEIDKLLHHGGGWLSCHPMKEEITRAYLKHQRSLISDALLRLTEEDGPGAEKKEQLYASKEGNIEKDISLREQRLSAVAGVLKEVQAKRVIDLGCGEGHLLRVLLEDRSFQEIAGMDVSYKSLEKTKYKLRFDQMAPMQKARIRLFQGSLVYRDKRLDTFDAVTVMEVIEHLDPHRLATFERVLFEFSKPKLVVVTTPNSEYNVKFKTLAAGEFRHKDHRFEWTRAEFKKWAEDVGKRNQYTVAYRPIGAEDASLGAPTQMAVFTRLST